MLNDPLQDDRLLQTMEAVRAGSDDLSDPAMADLAARLADSPEIVERYRWLKRLDARLAEALDDVPVPAGLAAAIVGRLAEVEAQRSDAASVPPKAADDAAVPGETELAVATHRAPRVSRRWLLVGGGLVAAASLFIGLWVGYFSTPRLTESTVLTAMRERFHADQKGFAEGGISATLHAVTAESIPAELPPSPAVVLIRGMQWREVGNVIGHRTVAYDFPSRRGDIPAATLYVMRASPDEPLATRPPEQPPISTGGVTLGSWQQGELLYVLAVRGGASTYRRLIAPPRHPLT